MFTFPLPITDQNREELARIRVEADALLDAPIASLSYRNFRLFTEKGSRGEYEAEYFEHRRRLCVFAAMALLGEDPRYTEALCDILWAICDEFTWALPAHLTKCKKSSERVKRIDLFAAETALALSELSSVLGDRLPEPVRDRISYELNRRIIDAYVQNRPRWAKSNWSGVCAAGVGCTMIYEKKDAALAAVLPDLQRSLSDFLDSYAEDGCCQEGSLYWSYGFSFFCYFADMLRDYTDGKIDYFADPKVERIARFGQNTYLGHGDCVLTFSDSPHRFKFDRGLFSILARHYEGICPPPPAFACRFGDDLRYRFAPFIRGLYSFAPEGKAPAGFAYYSQAQWYINKNHSYAFAAKAGNNDEPHNHNDVGSFLLFDRGKYILDDIGFPMYHRDYFTDRRYEDMCASSLGHSVPHLGGIGQKPGAEFAGQVLCAEENTFAAEIAPAYGSAGLRSLRRTFTLQESGIVLQDETEGDLPLTERFVTEIPPHAEGNRVQIADWVMEGEGVGAAQISTFSYYSRFAEFDAAESAPHTVYCIDFPCTEAVAKFRIRRV